MKDTQKKEGKLENYNEEKKELPDACGKIIQYLWMTEWRN
jgi:hypothetical protein